MTRKLLIPIVALMTLATLLLAIACGSDSPTPTPLPTIAPAPTADSAAAAPSVNPTTPPTPVPAPSQKLSIVTTTNIIADWARAIGQDRVDVTPLLPPNADPHTYQPGAQDIARVADADLILSNGLALEAAWFNDLIQNAAQSPNAIIPLGDAVDPLEFTEIFEEPEVPLHGRLLIGDGETGAMSVIHLEENEVEQDAFDLGARAGRIYPTKSGRYAFAVSTDADTVHLFDGGIYYEDHEGHPDLVEDPLTKLPIDLAGDRPVHLVVAQKWAAIFYDGSGDILMLNEHQLEEQGAAYAPPRINVGPHHGAAVPFDHDLFAVSIPHPEYTPDTEVRDYILPIGAEIVDVTGAVLHREESCPGLHGDAGNGTTAVFGCIGGAMYLEAHDNQFSGGFIPAPAGSPDDFRLGTIWGHPALHHFFAFGGAVGLYLVEPETGDMEPIIPATETLNPVSIALSHDAEHLLVIMSDGELRMYDAHDLDLLASASGFLADPIETGFWARPNIITAQDAIFITDSTAGQVLQLDSHDLEVVEQWAVAGNPNKIAFVGITGETGEAEDDEHVGEAEEDEHADEAEDEHAGEAEDPHAAHGEGGLDPHFWFDPLRVQQAINNIADRLAAIDPRNQTFYRANADAYTQELNDLHHWIQEQSNALPPERRLLVTSHDAFQYFARRYGFQVVGAVIPSISTDAEPTARDLASLIETIEHQNAPAVFTEKSHSTRFAQRVAEATGAALIGGLYTGSLGAPNGEAGTYLDFMRYNTQTIIEALQ